MWSSSRSMRTSASTTSTSSSAVKSWTQAFTSSLLTLGEEEVDAETVAKSALSSISVGGGGGVSGGGSSSSRSWRDSSIVRRGSQQSQQQQQQPQRQVLPKVLEDSCSVLTTDDPHPLWTREELLQQKDDELREVLEVQKVQNEELHEMRAELTKLRLKHKQQQREWAMSIEDLQSQKIVLQERLDVMDDDLNSEDLMQQLEQLITEEAPNELQNYHAESTDINTTSNHKGRLGQHLSANGRNDGDVVHDADQENDDAASKASVRSNTSGFGSRWGLGGSRQAGTPRLTNQQLQNHIRIMEEYITKLQSQLVQLMHKMRVLSNQISTMEEAHQDQMSKVIHKIKECEQERSRIEVESEEKLQTLQHEKKMSEQAILAKLDTKNEQMRRMEEHIEELREIAESAKLSQQHWEGNSQQSSYLYQQFDAEKMRLETQHRLEKEALQAEVMRLKDRNDNLERSIERLLERKNISHLETIGLEDVDDDPNPQTKYEALSSGDRGTTSFLGFPSSRSGRRQSSTNGSSQSNTSHRSNSPHRRHRSLSSTSTEFSSRNRSYSTLHKSDDEDDDLGSFDQTSLASYDYDDPEKKLHVEKQRPVEKREFRRLSKILQDTKLAEMDPISREKAKAVESRFL